MQGMIVASMGVPHLPDMTERGPRTGRLSIENEPARPRAAFQRRAEPFIVS
jgi:hypothetical protein